MSGQSDPFERPPATSMMSPSTPGSSMPFLDTASVAHELPPALRALVAPLRKVPFGLAFGAVGALLLAGATLILVIKGGDDAGDALGRLSNFLPYYGMSGAGVALGAVYGFLGGFVAGWLTAGARNLGVALYVFLVAARERARASGNVLDDLS